MKLHLLSLLVLQAHQVVAFIRPLASSRSHSLSQVFSTMEDVSPFDAYQPGETNTLVYKDEAFGEGDTVAEKGDVLTIAFVGRVYPSGFQFAKNQDFVFELGKGESLPGFDDGLVGVKVGAKRVLRVPPSLAFGERGSPPKIPPNADLEFETEIKGIARGQIQGTFAKIGATRALLFVSCCAILAISPMLPS